MKKSLSLFLALIMAMSVFSGINLSANAQAVQVDRVEYKGVNPIELVENVDGYWCDDGDESYFVYDYYFNEGNSLTVFFTDGTEKTYTYSEYYDSEADLYYFDFIDENGVAGDISVFVSDEQFNEHWGVGTHNATYTIEHGDSYDVGGYYSATVSIPITVVENPYIGVVYTPVKPFEVIENNNNYGYRSTDDETGEEYFYYWGYSPEYGDKITLQLKNGSKVVYSYVYDEDTDDSYFVSTNGDVIDWEDFGFYNNQFEDNGWYPGCKNAKCTFNYYGFTYDIPVTVKANPYSFVEFIPAQPIQFVENCNGEMNYDADESYFMYYDYKVQDGDKLVVHFNDKSKPAKTLVYDSESARFVAADGSSIGDYYVSNNQYGEWKVGGKGYTGVISVLGFDVEFPIEVVENPYKSIKFIPIEPIEYIENTNGHIEVDDTGNEFFYYENIYRKLYNDGSIIEITMADGSVKKYICSDGDFYDADGNMLDFDYDTSQYEKPWVKGAENFITISAFGIETKVPAAVVENPVKSIECSVKSLTCKENTYGYWHYDYETGNKYFIYLVNEMFNDGDTLTIHMKDGSSKVYTCKKYVSDGYNQVDFFDENNNILSIWNDTDEQYENHWGLGEHTLVIDVEDYNVQIEIPLIITKGTSQDCWHTYYDDYKNINGYLTQVCVGCGYQNKIPFADLGNYAYYGYYVEYTSVLNKFITGTNPPARTLFSPTTAITRAMFITILYRMAGEPYANNNPYKTSPFTDITNTGVYYYDAACWALDNDITTQRTFKPYDNVSREQTASFLFRYAKENNMLGDESYKNINLASYPDFKDVHAWAVEALKWANYNGMITGTQQGYINPQGATQRIHATKILYNFGCTCEIGMFE